MVSTEVFFVLFHRLYCCWMILLASLLIPGPAGAQQMPGVLRIKIRLQKGAAGPRVTVAPLMYDKDFAFSFTLDDGLISDYLVALPFFRGGKVAGPYRDRWGSDQGADGSAYPGLFYTDGCGHRLPFRAGIALNGSHIAADTVIAPGFLSWAQVDSLYQAGWDVLSHGYRHLTGAGVDAAQEVRQNNRAVEDHLHVMMRDFVIPGGKDDYLSDDPYTEAAFRAGMETVQCEHFGSGFVRLDSISGVSALKLGRRFLHTSVRDGPTKGDASVFRQITDGLAIHDKFWINAFTHGMGNENLWHISWVFPEFKAFFQRLAAVYGKGGMDNMWMAPTPEVFEYLMTRRMARCQVEESGRSLLVTIDLSKVPLDSRYHELTLVVEGGVVKKVKGFNCRAEDAPGGQSPEIVNLAW